MACSCISEDLACIVRAALGTGAREHQKLLRVRPWHGLASCARTAQRMAQNAASGHSSRVNGKEQRGHRRPRASLPFQNQERDPRRHQHFHCSFSSDAHRGISRTIIPHARRCASRQARRRVQAGKTGLPTADCSTAGRLQVLATQSVLPLRWHSGRICPSRSSFTVRAALRDRR